VHINIVTKCDKLMKNEKLVVGPAHFSGQVSHVHVIWSPYFPKRSRRRPGLLTDAYKDICFVTCVAW